MPTLYVKLVLKQNDTDCPKGEDLDLEVESALEGIEIDGYDIEAVVSREKQAKFTADTIQFLRTVAEHYGLPKDQNPYFDNNKRFLIKIADRLEGKE